MTLLIAVISAFFIMMQMYVYQLMAGFNFKVKDIYKNSLLLTMIKLPWNIFITVTVVVIMYTLYSVSMTSPLLAIILFVVVYIVLVYFTQLFMTKGVVEKYILEPSQKDDTNN